MRFLCDNVIKLLQRKRFDKLYKSIFFFLLFFLRLWHRLIVISHIRIYLYNILNTIKCFFLVYNIIVIVIPDIFNRLLFAILWYSKQIVPPVLLSQRIWFYYWMPTCPSITGYCSRWRTTTVSKAIISFSTS